MNQRFVLFGSAAVGLGALLAWRMLAPDSPTPGSLPEIILRSDVSGNAFAMGVAGVTNDVRGASQVGIFFGTPNCSENRLTMLRWERYQATTGNWLKVPHPSEGREWPVVPNTQRIFYVPMATTTGVCRVTFALSQRIALDEYLINVIGQRSGKPFGNPRPREMTTPEFDTAKLEPAGVVIARHKLALSRHKLP